MFQWSPDKASVFGSAAEDGFLSVWDYDKVCNVYDLQFHDAGTAATTSSTAIINNINIMLYPFFSLNDNSVTKGRSTVQHMREYYEIPTNKIQTAWWRKNLWVHDHQALNSKYMTTHQQIGE